MIEFAGKFIAGREEESFSAVFDLIYGVEKNTLSFDGRADITPLLMKSEVAWKSSAFPMTEFVGKFMAGREEESLLAMFDLTYGLEKNMISLNGRANITPMLMKSEVAWKSSAFPMTEFVGNFKAGREEESLLAMFDLTYGLEKKMISFYGRADITPMLLKSEVSLKSSEFPMTEFIGMIEAGLKEETLLTKFDLTYGLEKNMISFNGRADITLILLKGDLAFRSSEFPMTEFVGKFIAGREEESLLAMFDLVYGLEKNTISFNGRADITPMLMKGDFTLRSSEFPMIEFAE